MNDGPIWEVQWHPAEGGRVRRLALTRRGVRHAIVALVAAAVVLLGVMGVIPIGLRGVLQRFTVDSAHRENESLRARGEALREEALALARRTRLLAQRGRRLAWMLGLPPAAWRDAPGELPGPAALDGEVVSWLERGSARLEALAVALTGAGRASPCPFAALPSGLPIDLERAVQVANFGWHTSAFTGREEAHYGTTLAAPLGEPVKAPGAGRVLFAGVVRERRANEWNRFGNIVVLDHGGRVFSVLGHLRDITVRRGRTVSRGDLVGHVGQTGWTRVPALYFEVRWPWQGSTVPVDPALVALALPLDDLDARLERPDYDLPSGFALIEHLPRR